MKTYVNSKILVCNKTVAPGKKIQKSINVGVRFFWTLEYLEEISLNVNIARHDLIHKKTVFDNFMIWVLKKEIDVDSGPFSYL